MKEKDKIIVKGEVIDILPNRFIVRTENDIEISATVSGKMRVNSIFLLVGDKVTVELSVYDLSKGRIVRRL